MNNTIKGHLKILHLLVQIMVKYKWFPAIQCACPWIKTKPEWKPVEGTERVKERWTIPSSKAMLLISSRRYEALWSAFYSNSRCSGAKFCSYNPEEKQQALTDVFSQCLPLACSLLDWHTSIPRIINDSIVSLMASSRCTSCLDNTKTLWLLEPI